MVGKEHQKKVDREEHLVMERGGEKALLETDLMETEEAPLSEHHQAGFDHPHDVAPGQE